MHFFSSGKIGVIYTYSNEEGVGVGRRDSSRDFMTFLIIVIKYVYNIYIIYTYIKQIGFKKKAFIFLLKIGILKLILNTLPFMTGSFRIY